MNIERHHNNLINAFLVNVGIRPSCLLQYIDYENNIDAEQTLEKIKTLFPDLYHTKNYQGMILCKKDLTNIQINTSKKLGDILGYPCSDDFNQIIQQNISGYVIELTCYYCYDDVIYKTQLIANRCIELNKLDDFYTIEKKCKKYIGHEIDNIELVNFIVTYEKNYNTNDIIDYVYNNKPYDPTINYHIGNIIYNMGITHDNEMIDNSFNYSKRWHRMIICLYLWLDLILDRYQIQLSDKMCKVLKWLLQVLLC